MTARNVTVGVAAAIEAQVYSDDLGEWRWRVRSAGNHKILASGEGYCRRVDAVRCVELVCGADRVEWIEVTR